jgi:hypothetical protein
MEHLQHPAGAEISQPILTFSMRFLLDDAMA